MTAALRGSGKSAAAWFAAGSALTGLLAYAASLRSAPPSGGEAPSPQASGPESAPRDGRRWTCSMHPQIRALAPGRCPLCGMDLTPAAARTDGAGVTLSEAGRRAARVETAAARRAEALYTIRTIGRFVFDDTRIHRLSAYLTGRVEAVHAPLEGAFLEEGAPLVDLYAPELPGLLAELRAAEKLGADVRGAVAERLRRYGLRDEDLESLSREPNPFPKVTLRAAAGGLVVERPVKPGVFVSEGDLFVAVADVASLFVEADLFERDVPFVAPGTPASITVDALADASLEAIVESVKPTVDPEFRTARVRLRVPNPGGRARPGMLARVAFGIALGASGEPRSVASGAESRPESRGISAAYACPMACIPLQSEPGRCPNCGMKLVRTGALSAPSVDVPLLVPSTAVLDLGRRRLVYVETSERHYEPREVQCGPRIGPDVVVRSGLEEGERVVFRGAFLVDSQAQIEGRECLILTDRPRGEDRPAHDHGGRR